MTSTSSYRLETMSGKGLSTLPVSDNDATARYTIGSKVIINLTKRVAIIQLITSYGYVLENYPGQFFPAFCIKPANPP